MAIEIRQRLKAAVKEINQTFTITTHPTVAIALLGDQMQNIEELEQSLTSRFFIRVDEKMHEESFQIEPTQPNSLNQIINQRYTLGPNDPLYPQETPEFATWKGHLVKLPTTVPVSDKPPYLNEVIVLEISISGRWFASAQIARNPTDDT
jgi:predicted HicB family RNase H-like nuclease